MTRRVTGKDVAVAVGVGVAVAGLAGLAAGAALGTGVVALATSSRRSKKGLKPESIRRDAEGRLQDLPGVLKAVQKGGIAPELRPELWPVLLGVFDPGSTEDERLRTLAQLHRLYIKLVLVCEELEREVEAAKRSQAGASSAAAAVGGSPGRPGSSGSGSGTPGVEGPGEDGEGEGEEERQLPGGLMAFADAHRIIVMDVVRTDFARQPDDSVAPAASRATASGGSASSFGSPTVTILPVAVVDGIPEIVLVDHPPPAPGDPSARADAADAAAAAAGMNGNTPLWTSRLAGEALAGATHVPERCRRQMLRLVNLLSAYAIHDPETSYCQGMSDLAAVFIQMFEDDALAFACFERLMRQARRNFKHDETGIKQQLRQVAGILEHTDPSVYQRLCTLQAQDCMFAYRMVVVMLRRELSAEHTMTLWEVQWAHEASTELETQAAVQLPGSLQRSSSSRAMSRSASSSGCAAAPATAAGTAAEQQGPGSGGSAAITPGVAAAAAVVPPRPGSAGGSFNGGSGAAAAAAASGRSGAEVEDGNFQHWFIASAVRAQRWELMHLCHDTDDVLRLFNGVRIDFWATLAHAEKCFQRYAQGRAVMQRL